jgi:hypothetical protein
MRLIHIKRVTEVYLHTLLISTLDGRECSASCPASCSSRERTPSTHWLGELIRNTANPNVVANRKFHAPDTNQSPAIRPRSITIMIPDSSSDIGVPVCSSHRIIGYNNVTIGYNTQFRREK